MIWRTPRVLRHLGSDLVACVRAFRSWRRSEVPSLWTLPVPFMPGLPPLLVLPDEVSAPRVPEEMDPEDPLLRAVQGWEVSQREGRSTWGSVLLAEKALFQGGGSDHAGMVIWSPTGEFDRHPERLRRIGQTIFAQRDADDADPDLEALRTVIRDPAQRVAGFWVPSKLTGGSPVFLSSVLLHRRHLPRGLLLRDLVPLRVGEEWDFPVVVPASHWGPELSDWWTSSFDLLVLERRVSVLGDGRRGTDLPDWVRHFFLRNRKPLLNTIGLAGALTFLSIGLFGLAVSVGTSMDTRTWVLALRVAALALPVLTAFLGVAWLGWVTLTWSRHMRLVDAYSVVWRERLFPWTRFFLVPTSLGFGFSSYNLSLKVLGSWVTLSPDFPEDKIRLGLSGVGEDSEDPLDTAPSKWSSVGMDVIFRDRHAARGVLRELFSSGDGGPGLMAAGGPA
ncbi:MAG: hypothetical protein IPK50_04040 [Fibrobacterota bacterium]|nr:MAG: hypothetical protein IPK50_04040 [Fibrobacterota bacterium]